MKILKISFLFFLSCILFNTNELYSQTQITDSLDYYQDLYNKPKKVGDEIKALKYFQNEIFLLKGNKNALRNTRVLILIAQIEKKLGFSIDSENTIVKALELLPEIKDNDSTVAKRHVSIYNHLGKIYREYEDYNKALEFYHEANSRAYDLKDSITIINNIGYLYLEQEKYDLAIEKFKKAYNKSLKIVDKKQEARALDNLGVVQSKIGDSGASFSLIKALKIRMEEKYDNGIISSYINLGEHFKEIKQDSIANEYANKASSIANRTNNILHKQGALSLKMKLKKDVVYGQLKLINDSINNSKKSSSVKYATYKYQKGEADKAADKAADKSKRITERVIIASVFLIIIFTLIYYFLKSKHKKDKLLQVYNTETRISKKVHDEVANDVFQVMVQLQSEPKANDSLIDDLEDIYTKTRDISKEHSLLDFKEPFKDILNDLLLSYNGDSANVVARDIAKIDWVSVSEIKKTTIYKVLQEFMINMKKHSKASVAALTFKQAKKKITITYSDNGIGTILKKNTGLQNVENRIKSINGTVNFESEINKGFKAKITV